MTADVSLFMTRAVVAGIRLGRRIFLREAYATRNLTLSAYTEVYCFVGSVQRKIMMRISVGRQVRNRASGG
jgi:hypothetical protein